MAKRFFRRNRQKQEAIRRSEIRRECRSKAEYNKKIVKELTGGAIRKAREDANKDK